MSPFSRCLLVLLLALAPLASRAAITCNSLSATSYSVNYVSGTTTNTMMTITVICSRALTTDPTSVTLSVTANNGLYSNGVNNNARLVSGGTTEDIRYDVYTDQCTTKWKGATALPVTVTWPSTSITGNSTGTANFYACIATASTPTLSGFHADTITFTGAYTSGGTSTTVSGTMSISVFAPSSCVINSGPGNFALSYTAFQVAALVSSRSFTNTCSSGMSYSFSVVPSTGTINGVNYTVDITDTGNTGTVQTTVLGNGALQTYWARVTAAAGQAGTCNAASCAGTAVTHTLTITY